MNIFEGRPVYEALCGEKDKGIEFHEGKLSSEIIYELWVEEFLGDSYIAALFNTTARRVRTLREMCNITHRSSIDMKMDKCERVLGPVGAAIMAV